MNAIIFDVKMRSIQDEYLEELQNLIVTAGNIKVLKTFRRKGKICPKTFIGQGRLDDAKDFCANNTVDMVIINAKLQTKQLMLLQKELKATILDKVDIILKIFEKHAKTREAKLQIELAKIKYQIPRIYAYDSKTLFEKSGGGIGTRGAGEKGIEAEKRHLRKLMKQIEDKLQKVRSTRDIQRKKRDKVPFPMVAIVGYTNAGKSTFLNTLTGKEVYRADELFATLDTRISRYYSHDLGKLILFSDTIGFIRDFPPQVIESFKATLDEARMADVILHVFDGSVPNWRSRLQATEDILCDIGCDTIPRILVANKCDYACPLGVDALMVSAIKKQTLQVVVQKVEKVLSKQC